MLPSDLIVYDILICRENFETDESKWCILTLFDTIFLHAENFLQSDEAKWCILMLF